MSASRTQTVPPEQQFFPHIVLEETTFNAEDIRHQIQALAQIFLIHDQEEEQGQWRDRTSQQLFRWGASVFELNDRLEEALGDKEGFLKLIEERLHELFYNILVNPLKQKTHLHDPVIDGKWMWEKRMHEHFLLVKRVAKQLAPEQPVESPFDNQTLSKEPQEHVFAKEVLTWALAIIKKTKVAPESAIPADEVTIEQPVVLHDQELSPQAAQLHLLNYNLAAQRYVRETSKKDSIKRQAETEKAMEQDRLDNEKLRTEIRNALNSAREVIRQKEEAWARRLAESEQKHTQAYATYQTETSTLKERHQTLNEKTDQLTADAEAVRQRVLNLKYSVAAKQQVFDHMNLSSDGHSCTIL
jgi:hypothetical protein